MERLLLIMAEHPADSLSVVLFLAALSIALWRGRAIVRQVIGSIRIGRRQSGRRMKGGLVRPKHGNRQAAASAGSKPMRKEPAAEGRGARNGQTRKETPAIRADDVRKRPRVRSGRMRIRPRHLLTGLTIAAIACSGLVLLGGELRLFLREASGDEGTPVQQDAFVILQETAALLVLGAALIATVRRYAMRKQRLRFGMRQLLPFFLVAVWSVSFLLTISFDKLRERADSGAGTAAIQESQLPVNRPGLGGTMPANPAPRAVTVEIPNPLNWTLTQDSLAFHPDRLDGLLMLQTLIAAREEWVTTSVLANQQETRQADYRLVRSGGHSLTSFAADELGSTFRTAAAAEWGYRLLWWLQYGILLAGLVFVPRADHVHWFAAPIVLWHKRNGVRRSLEPLDLEDETVDIFGVQAIEHFAGKGLLALHACIGCGQCTAVCPASATGKLLSPMHLIVKLRDHLLEKHAAVTSRHTAWVSVHHAAAGKGAHVMGSAMPLWVPGLTHTGTSIEPTMAAQRRAWSPVPGRSPLDVQLAGEVITDEELWACTTCGSCDAHCPAGIEPLSAIIELRRGLVLMEGEVPADAQRTLLHIERYGNPWGLPKSRRSDWIAAYEAVSEAPLTTAQDAARRGEPLPELVVWAGTMGAYDPRSRKVLFALLKLLQHAGVPFAVLGGEERSSGDTARRMGDELLFQSLCKENIETLHKYGVRHLVTICPHTYHAMKQEYPDFGLRADLKIEHHLTLLAGLVKEGRIKPAWRVEERVVYHDACYLGRYNDEYEAPRELLRAMVGVRLAEMEHNRGRSMCCGAGGGLMWQQPRAGMPMQAARTAEALDTNPTVIASACPYCLSMMEQGAAQHKPASPVKTRDVAELLLFSVFGYEEV